MNSVRISKSLYKPTKIPSNVNGCGFRVTCLWLELAASTQLLHDHTPASSCRLRRKKTCTATETLSLSNALNLQAKRDDYKHEAVIAVIAAAEQFAILALWRIKANSTSNGSAQAHRCCQA